MPSSKYFYKPVSAAYYNPAVDRKVAIVTGGNAGLGWFTVLHLYLHGFVVYIAGRNPQKVKKAIEELIEEAAKRTSTYSDAEKKSRFLGELKTLSIDCCDLASVEKCAEDFSAKESKLDLLINNAGVMAVPFEMTKDGYEIQYQVNLVAPFLFTMKLIPVLEKAVTPTSAPRVITLSSMGHYYSLKYWEPSNLIKKSPDMFFTTVRYGNAKRGAIEFMSRFATEFPEFLSFSVHPGVIVETGLYDWWANMPVFGPVMRLFLKGISKSLGVTCEEGALATLKSALDPELGHKQSGAFVVRGGFVTKPSRLAQKPQNIDTTWKYLETEMVKKGYFKN